MIKRRALAVTLALGFLFGSIGLPAEEIKVEIRPRKDKNVASDIQAVLELQRKYLASQAPSGLSDLASQAFAPQTLNKNGPLATTQNAHEEMLENGNSIVISCNPIVIGDMPYQSENLEGSRNNAVLSSQVIHDSVVQASATSPSLTTPRDTDSAKQPVLARERQPMVHQLKILPPPTITYIQENEFAGISENNPDSTQATQRLRPVSVQSLADAESMTKPKLSVGSSSDLNAVQPAITIQPNATGTVVGAAYQVPGGFTPPPNFVAPPATNLAPSPSSTPVLPNASNPNILPSVPGTNIIPPTSYPTFPMYQPNSPGRVMSEEPFVTAPPCQFDARYMVEPTCYMPAADTGCGASGGPAYPPYSGLPGNLAPPTYMANQFPGLYMGGRPGWRPLIGFGQENYNVQLGRGIIGQPVAYVPGQPFRNFLRYISP